MRIRRRYAAILALALAGAVAVAGIALAAANGNSSFITGKFQPNLVPKKKFHKGKITIHSHTDFAAPGNRPAGGFTHRVQIKIDDDIKFNTKGVAKCNPNGFTSNETMASAMTKCGDAKVGKGTAHTANGFAACVLVFNGKKQNNHRTVILFTRVTFGPTAVCSSPRTNTSGNASTTLVGELKGASGDYGTQLDVNDIDQGQLPLDDFVATLKRGRFVKARCHDSNHKWNFKGKHTYSDGQVDSNELDSQ